MTAHNDDVVYHDGEVIKIDLECMSGLKPSFGGLEPDWIDRILEGLSAEQIAELRREIDQQFDLALICYQIIRH